MRMLAAFLSAVSTAAFVFDLGLLLESLSLGEGMGANDFAFAFSLNVLVGSAVGLLGGLPIWFILRRRSALSLKTFAIAGASLGVFTYLLLVSLGIGAPSDRPMSFAENIARPFQILRIAYVLLAGAGGAAVFRNIANPRVEAD